MIFLWRGCVNFLTTVTDVNTIKKLDQETWLFRTHLDYLLVKI